ncbi:hypothetical protein NEUTE2DRAFT_170598 [Neurospora tetrasperma FGSC 2509]|nr:hypothetical protein NEUTE2DRAFT_170598 [Neurospora tetrasperma FGSC 2509]
MNPTVKEASSFRTNRTSNKYHSLIPLTIRYLVLNEPLSYGEAFIIRRIHNNSTEPLTKLSPQWNCLRILEDFSNGSYCVLWTGKKSLITAFNACV